MAELDQCRCVRYNAFLSQGLRITENLQHRQCRGKLVDAVWIEATLTHVVKARFGSEEGVNEDRSWTNEGGIG